MITESTPKTWAIRSGREDLACGAVCDQPAAIDHHHPVGKSRGKRKIVQDCQHCTAVVRYAGQQSHHSELMARIERHRRLVGEQDRRLRRQRPRQRHPRALAARQRRHRACRQRLDPGGGERPAYGGAIVIRQRCESVRVRMAAERDNGCDVHRPVYDVSLRQIGDMACPLVR